MIALALALLPAVAVGSPATAPVATPAVAEFRVPRNDGWVTDLAGLLSRSEERALEARLEEWSQRTGHQLAVLTIPSLDGEPIERASLAVARAWGIGHGQRDDGALLFVAQGDRKLRIEVGNGLESALTDSISGRIIREIVAPQFRANHASSGIRAGVEALITVVEQGVEAVPALKRNQQRGAVVIPLVVCGVLLLLIFARILHKLGGGGPPRGGGRARAGGPGWPFFMGTGGLGGGGFSGRGGGFGGGGFGGFGGGGFSGGGASGGW
ncbi:MAG: TPM domain-containing protein [Planctomycetes bacterium]|nr:TPM domain-containing protein [Planctomycetota bacterium]